MSATTIGGCLRGLLLSTAKFGEGRVWADEAPDGATFPYSTFSDHLTTIPSLKGDGRTIMLDRMCQVDLWQPLGKADPEVLRAVYAAIDGAKVVLDDATIMRLSITDTQRLVEQDTDIDHVALTVSVSHDPRAL